MENADNMGKSLQKWTDTEFQQTDGTHTKDSNRNMKNKNTVTEMNNVFYGLVRFNRDEERINEFENR